MGEEEETKFIFSYGIWQVSHIEEKEGKKKKRFDRKRERRNKAEEEGGILFVSFSSNPKSETERGKGKRKESFYLGKYELHYV